MPAEWPSVGIVKLFGKRTPISNSHVFAMTRPYLARIALCFFPAQNVDASRLRSIQIGPHPRLRGAISSVASRRAAFWPVSRAVHFWLCNYCLDQFGRRSQIAGTHIASASSCSRSFAFSLIVRPDNFVPAGSRADSKRIPDFPYAIRPLRLAGKAAVVASLRGRR
jgi:hypothetical protein